MDIYPKTITLPISGKTATIQRRIKGRDMRFAERAAGRKADATQRGFAMVAQVVLLDGNPVVMEDFDDLDLDDINEVFRALGLTGEQEEEGPKNSQTQPASQPSSNGVSQPQNSTK